MVGWVERSETHRSPKMVGFLDTYVSIKARILHNNVNFNIYY